MYIPWLLRFILEYIDSCLHIHAKGEETVHQRGGAGGPSTSEGYLDMHIYINTNENLHKHVQN